MVKVRQSVPVAKVMLCSRAPTGDALSLTSTPGPQAESAIPNPTAAATRDGPSTPQVYRDAQGDVARADLPPIIARRISPGAAAALEGFSFFRCSMRFIQVSELSQDHRKISQGARKLRQERLRYLRRQPSSYLHHLSHRRQALLPALQLAQPGGEGAQGFGQCREEGRARRR